MTRTLLDVLRKKWVEIGSSADVMLKSLSLGVIDPTTGWYATIYTNSIIEAYIVPRQLQRLILSVGYFTTYSAVAFSNSEMKEGDFLYDGEDYFRVMPVKYHTILNRGIMYEAQLELITAHTGGEGGAPGIGTETHGVSLLAEIIENGSVETGDFTSWTSGGASVVNTEYHTGAWSARLINGWMRQTLNEPVADVDSFTFWIYGGTTGEFGYIRVYYTDASFTELNFSDEGIAAWAEIDVKPSLTAGKTIDYIEIFGPAANPTYVDDVSCMAY